MKNRIRVIDIGGSGIKTMHFLIKDGSIYEVEECQYLKNPDFINFSDWLLQNLPNDFDVLGISCPGIIDKDNIIHYCAIAQWKNFDIINYTKQIYPNAHIFLMNDANAHLMANASLFKHPIMQISLGTSIGFALTDNEGNIYYSNYGTNIEVGGVILKTNAKLPSAWWALGSHGLQDLQKELGEDAGSYKFGLRLGGFLANMCHIYNPNTIVLSGGILAQNFSKNLLAGVKDEMNAEVYKLPKQPFIEISRFERETALWGLVHFYLYHNS